MIRHLVRFDYVIYYLRWCIYSGRCFLSFFCSSISSSDFCQLSSCRLWTPGWCTESVADKFFRSSWTSYQGLVDCLIDYNLRVDFDECPGFVGQFEPFCQNQSSICTAFAWVQLGPDLVCFPPEQVGGCTGCNTLLSWVGEVVVDHRLFLVA